MISLDPLVSNSVNRLNKTTNRLHDTIEVQIKATNRQSRIMFWLTCAAVLLAIVQTGSSVAQIWLAFR